jgi:antitoxin (DNA-binding transcriptional repressor) of toxin-antitoxin stability system
VTITHRGAPIAKVVPIDEAGALPIPETVRQIRQFRRGKRLDGLSVRELIDDGRKR